jgi:hypothetical protein
MEEEICRIVSQEKSKEEKHWSTRSLRNGSGLATRRYTGFCRNTECHRT